MLSKRTYCRTAVQFLTAVFLVGTSTIALSDGTEFLGPITAASGSRIIGAGVGLEISQVGQTIDFEIPAGAVVKQVFAYWEGNSKIATAPATDSIMIAGQSITGDFIGGFHASGGTQFLTYRADITANGIVGVGPNSIPVSGMTFEQNNGAGIAVIIDDGTSASIEMRDGSDRAYFAADAPEKETVLQTFTFAAAAQERSGQLTLFFSDVRGVASGGVFRPSNIEVQVGGGVVQQFPDTLNSDDGQEWDTVVLDLVIPAGVTQVKVQALSEDLGFTPDAGAPASFTWLMSGLSVTDVPPILGRMTGGGKQIRVNPVRMTRGFTIHCDITLSNNIEVNWPGNKWHLTKPITSALCLDDPTKDPRPPVAPFDTFIGEGVGKLNGVEGSVLRFVFIDDGEPGRKDQASIRIWAPGDDPDSDTPVVDVSGNLDRGNLQAHYDQPHK